MIDSKNIDAINFLGTIQKSAQKVNFPTASNTFRSMPCPYVEFDNNGLMIYFNPAFQSLFQIVNPAEILGHMNAFTAAEFAGLNVRSKLRRGYEGETIFFTRLTPAVAQRFSEYIPMGPDLLVFFASTCMFPIYDFDDKIKGVGVLFYPQHNQNNGTPPDKVKNFIDQHWYEPLDMEEIAKSMSLNPDYLSKVFKREYGTTPFEYYRLVKLLHLKEKLCQPGLNVQQAFMECGMKYTGTAAAYF